MLRLWLGLVPLMLGACVENGELTLDVPEEEIEEEPLYSEDALVISFGSEEEDSWMAVNDTVMGGVSNGDLSYTDQSMLFEGVVSTDSNGGFTSVRSPRDVLDLSMYDRVLIRMKSEGQPFSMILAHNEYWFQDQFKYDIQVPNEEWNVIEVPLSDFQIYRLSGGYPTATGIEMTPEMSQEILHLEFMSKLFEDGAFRLEVDFIAFD